MKREEIIRDLTESMVKCEDCWIDVYMPGPDSETVELKNGMYITPEAHISEMWSLNAYSVKKEKTIRYNNGYIKTETHEFVFDDIIDYGTEME